MKNWYRENLAYIHDVGFSDFALKSFPDLLNTLHNHNINQGLIVELGCGSGLLAHKLVAANYDILGIDISPSMINIARQRVPQAEFKVASLFKTTIPPCRAVISVSECLNYLFDPDNNHQSLTHLFERVYQALELGGVFICDFLEPGEIIPNKTQKFREGKDWVVMIEKEEDPHKQKLTRRIITFRKVGEYYRRDEEVHQVQLYSAKEISDLMSQLGFKVEIKHSYGTFKLPDNHAVIVAYKPNFK